MRDPQSHDHDPRAVSHGHGHSATALDHDHGHTDMFHNHAPAGKMKRALLLTIIILLAEVVGGFLSHSLALLADAGHVVTDMAAIGLSWYALKQGEKPTNGRMTYGYHRAGILAALVNGAALLLITVWILLEAYGRFAHPTPVNSGWMFIGAGVGLAINLYLGLGMRGDEDINVRSAVLHMLGDAAASAAVIVGGAIILLTGWYTVDPLLSVLIALLIAYGAWQIVRQTVVILMEGTPKGVRFEQVIAAIRAVPGVGAVHDVHVWSITSGRNALSCHLVVDGALTVRDSQPILRDIEHQLIHLGIHHVTIQTEDADHPHQDTDLCCSSDLEH